ncbi:MAG TPA: hypothetical protein VN817_10645 [Solirubrobacteraceae bacterium]|nr:hypothetical protein [Solirubrobacteraceae bacterium]
MNTENAPRSGGGVPTEVPTASHETQTALRDGDRLHRFAATTPAARARQLANLEHARRRGGANLQHGAHSEQKLQRSREAYLAELSREFPHASERRLRVQAHRLAQLDALATFADERGVISHRRRGEVFPAAQLAERLAASYLLEHERLEVREKLAGEISPSTALAAIEAEYAARRGDPESVSDADIVAGEQEVAIHER